MAQFMADEILFGSIDGIFVLLWRIIVVRTIIGAGVETGGIQTNEAAVPGDHGVSLSVETVLVLHVRLAAAICPARSVHDAQGIVHTCVRFAFAIGWQASASTVVLSAGMAMT